MRYLQKFPIDYPSKYIQLTCTKCILLGFQIRFSDLNFEYSEIKN